MWRWVIDNLRGLLVVAASLLGFAAQSVPYLDVLREHGADAEVYRTRSLEARVRLMDDVGARGAAPVDIEVRNTSDAPYDLEVAVSDEIARSFDHVAMVPAPSTSDSWSVKLERVLPGEERLVAVELEGPKPGPHSGLVRIVASAGDELSIPIRTVITP